MICSKCGTVANPKTRTRGSIWIEIVLWCCFIIPGLIYTLWRLTSREDVCRACGSHELVPLDSPFGRQLAEKAGIDAPVPRAYVAPHAGAVGVGRGVGRFVRRLARGR